MNISTLSAEFALRPSTLRFYERRGLLTPAGKAAGRRIYDAGSRQRLAFIMEARRSGLTLNEIQDLIQRAGKGTPLNVLWRQTVRDKLVELDREMAALARQRTALLAKQRCRCRSLDDCERAAMQIPGSQ